MMIVVASLAVRAAADGRGGRRPVGFNDLGNLMLAFTMLWAYMSFSQYLIIWSGNLTEEIPWYLRRTRGGWQWVALALIVFHFFVPFFVLLFRENKRQPAGCWRVAAWILVDALARPGLAGRPGVDRPEPSPRIPWVELLVSLVALVGDRRASGWPSFLWRLKGWPLVPLNDPNSERGARARRRMTERGRRDPPRHRRAAGRRPGHESTTIAAARPRHLRGRPGRRRSSSSRSCSALVMTRLRSRGATSSRRCIPAGTAIDVGQFPQPRLQAEPADRAGRR